MRADSPGFIPFFLDLIFLAMVIPVTAWIINFFLSGLGPYNFTVYELLNEFFFQAELFLLSISDLIHFFWKTGIFFIVILVLAYIIGMVGGMAK